MKGTVSFNEEEWIRLVFLLSKTQTWVNELAISTMMQVPIRDRKRLFRKNYYLSITALAHIIERHYHKVPMHPCTSKFTIPLPELMQYLRDASKKPATPVPDSENLQHVIKCPHIIGFDNDQLPTSIITVFTDNAGRIITAFPGYHYSVQTTSNTLAQPARGACSILS